MEEFNGPPTYEQFDTSFLDAYYSEPTPAYLEFENDLSNFTPRIIGPSTNDLLGAFRVGADSPTFGQVSGAIRGAFTGVVDAFRAVNDGRAQIEQARLQRDISKSVLDTQRARASAAAVVASDPALNRVQATASAWLPILGVGYLIYKIVTKA